MKLKQISVLILLLTVVTAGCVETKIETKPVAINLNPGENVIVLSGHECFVENGFRKGVCQYEFSSNFANENLDRQINYFISEHNVSRIYRHGSGATIIYTGEKIINAHQEYTNRGDDYIREWIATTLP